MDFPFGIDKEAAIYCVSAQNAISQASADVIRNIQAQATAWRNFGTNTISYSDAIDEIVKYALENNTQMEWEPTDEEGMSWFLGIHCKAYDLACGESSRGFSEIFKDAFIRHFSQVEDPTAKRLAAMNAWLENREGVPPCSIDPFNGKIKWNI